ncbi:MAG: hypothetical protein HC888_05570 [Candidatus Competibacteraceae bacterium]|nr:hypothetical protein [Candidatus Competibacteraceae bacterium]
MLDRLFSADKIDISIFHIRPYSARLLCVIILCISTTCIIFSVQAQPTPILFPPDSGVVSVLDYGAVPNDGKDDTAAIQEAFEKNSGNGAVIYLPPGVYHISNTIKWPGRQSFNALQGAGPDHTILRLLIMPQATTIPTSQRT